MKIKISRITETRRCDAFIKSGARCQRTAVSPAFPTIDLTPEVLKTDKDVSFRCRIHIRRMQPAIQASTQLGGYIAICEIPEFRVWLNHIAQNPLCKHGFNAIDWQFKSVCYEEAPEPLKRIINGRGSEEALLWLGATILENRISKFEQHDAI